MSDKLSLLAKKLHDELDEYIELEKYRSAKCIPQSDGRYKLSSRIIALVEDGEMDLDEEVLGAMMEISGILCYCWDIYYERQVPIECLFRELMNCYYEGEVW